jgi:hypothetical protein
MSTISDVPADKVAENVDQLIQTGATEITCKKQADGNWTITAS